MKKTRGYWLWALMLLLCAGCEKAEDVTQLNIEEEILAEMEAQGIPSVVAGVIKDDAIVWEGAFGYADVATQTPATRETTYMMMSISKLFLATATMQLWEQGLINLEEDINQYLPFAVRNPKFPDIPITPYHLLTHRSGIAHPLHNEGIGDFEYFFPIDQVPSIREWLPEYLLPGGAKYDDWVWKDFAPGEMDLYSNIGTSLLALIVEEVSGMDYRDYVIQQILEPLEMYQSGFRLTDVNENLLATPHYDNGVPFYPYSYRHYPAGNLISNLEDMSHFIMAFLNDGVYKGKRTLELSTIEKMWELQNPVTGMSHLWFHCLGDCIGHSGGGTGYKLRAEWYYQDGEGLIIFSSKVNSSVTPRGRIYELVRLKREQL